MKKILPIILLLVFSLLVSCSNKNEDTQVYKFNVFKEYKLSMIMAGDALFIMVFIQMRFR